MNKRIIVFTGAGVSADSGIQTFRDSDGLWANYRIEDVCTPEALIHNRKQVIEFYNMRRKEVLEKQPNAAHLALADLQNYADVEIITQNIDDLHERAGSKKVLHLHGEILKLRSSINAHAIVPLEGWQQSLDAKHEDGSWLRPFVVFFGEAVPMMDKAIEVVQTADILLVIGTSLAVYPAASLVHYVSKTIPMYVVDPADISIANNRNIQHFKMRAAEGVPVLVQQLKKEYLG